MLKRIWIILQELFIMMSLWQEASFDRLCRWFRFWLHVHRLNAYKCLVLMAKTAQSLEELKCVHFAYRRFNRAEFHWGNVSIECENMASVILKKAISLATTVDDLRVIHNSFYDEDDFVDDSLIIRWIQVSSCYQDMKGCPWTPDEVLNKLRVERKQSLLEGEIRDANTLEEIYDLWKRTPGESMFYYEWKACNIEIYNAMCLLLEKWGKLVDQYLESALPSIKTIEDIKRIWEMSFGSESAREKLYLMWIAKSLEGIRLIATLPDVQEVALRLPEFDCSFQDCVILYKAFYFKWIELADSLEEVRKIDASMCSTLDLYDKLSERFDQLCDARKSPVEVSC